MTSSDNCFSFPVLEFLKNCFSPCFFDKIDKKNEMASSDTCFSSALLDLEFLRNKIYRTECLSGLKEVSDAVSNQIRNLRTFHLFARRWGYDYVDDYENEAIFSLGALLVEIEDAVSEIAQHIHPFHVSWEAIFPEGEENDFDEELWEKLAVALVNACSFKEKINGWYVKFSDWPRQSISSCSSGHDLVEFIESTLGRADHRSNKSYEGLRNLLESLEEELTFLKNFIRFLTALQAGEDGDDRHLGQNLLTHIKAVAVTAAHASYRVQLAMGYQSDPDDDEDHHHKLREMQFMKRIKAVDPHVYQIYTQVLNHSKLSARQPRSVVVTLQMLQDFITSLLPYLLEILRAGTTPVFSNKIRLHFLYQGLRSLSVFLQKQSKNFDERMRDLTVVVACDVGVVIFSLFQDAIEQSFAQKMDLVLLDLFEKIKLIRAEVGGISPETGGSSMFNFPKVDELGSVDFLMENLTKLISYGVAAASSPAVPKHRIQTINKELEFLRSFLEKIVQLRDEKEELRTLWNRVVELAYRLEFLIDSSMLGDVPDDSSCQMSFDSISKEINIITLEARKISVVTKRTIDFLPLERSTPIIKEDIIRMDDEARSIIDRLTKGEKKLQIVPIVGMPGLGKTTLAKLVYNDFSRQSHFNIRAWCCISQVYDKKKLLLEILNCISSSISDKCEEDLALELLQNLRRQRYLIVLDDVWDIDVWNILKDTFPDDKNGSRILLTSRHVARDIASKGILDTKPHCLRPLNHKESWELLNAKLRLKYEWPPTSEWPPTLSKLVTQIVKRCNGLPLMIVVLAGILVEKDQNDWEEVVKCCLSSSSANILEQCKNILELSYKCLPEKLKPCFLYFGAFSEDREHTARELTLLWIAEGFVRKAQSKSLQHEAEDYLKELISRNLVIVDKKSSTGMIKTCRIHDLLHVFCLEKAKKENFFQLLEEYDESSDFSESQNARRLFIHCAKEHLKKSRLSCPQLRSLFFCRQDDWHWCLKSGLNPLSYIGNSKLVRVLDLRQIYPDDMFLDELTSMVLLRYLVIGGPIRSIPSSIANLSNLETLIVAGYSNKIELPVGFWKLKELRHLWSYRGAFKYSGEYLGNWAKLLNLETLRALELCWGDREMMLKKFPNIRELKVRYWWLDYGASAESGENKKVLELDSFSRLESFEVCGKEPIPESWQQQIDICFPSNLRKLTLKDLCLSWCKISAIGKLPNLEVLKLLNNSFTGEIWNMKEAEEFPKLIFLKLRGLDIVRWTSEESMGDHFPSLVKLVLYFCRSLQGVPSCLGDIPNLQMIEVSNCSKSAASSVEEVCENQEGMGNQILKVIKDSDSDDSE